MNMGRVQKSLGWAILVSETSHIFCCVLPTLFSVLTMAASLGVVAAVPAGLAGLHEVMHRWEAPVILFSGFLIFLGWGAHFLSEKIDCHSTGCAHGSCAPKKRKAGLVLKIATLLFVFNVSVYLLFHHGLEAILHLH